MKYKVWGVRGSPDWQPGMAGRALEDNITAWRTIQEQVQCGAGAGVWIQTGGNKVARMAGVIKQMVKDPLRN